MTFSLFMAMLAGVSGHGGWAAFWVFIHLVFNVWD